MNYKKDRIRKRQRSREGGQERDEVRREMKKRVSGMHFSANEDTFTVHTGHTYRIH